MEREIPFPEISKTSTLFRLSDGRVVVSASSILGANGWSPPSMLFIYDLELNAWSVPDGKCSGWGGSDWMSAGGSAYTYYSDTLYELSMQE